jgi:hypothetical protein
MLGLVLMLAGYALGGHQAARPDAVAGTDRAAAANLSGEPKTPLIRSLLYALKTVFIADRQTENSLIEADEKLHEVLGENSKRLIMEANRRPPVPSVELNFGPASGYAGQPVAKSGASDSPPSK